MDPEYSWLTVHGGERIALSFARMELCGDFAGGTTNPLGIPAAGRLGGSITLPEESAKRRWAVKALSFETPMLPEALHSHSHRLLIQ